MKISHLFAGLAALTLAVPAQAATVTRAFSITATDFNLLVGSSAIAPVDPVRLQGSLTLDNTQTYRQQTAGLSFTINLPLSATFSYDPSTDNVTIATFSDLNTCANGTESFCAFINTFSTNPRIEAVYQTTPANGLYVSTNITAGVPEPQSWALMIIGFGAIGAALRRHRKPSVSYA